ncbi:hypothetical protein [Priestia megaterium]|uniref:hypothetical protein n=1 Tax=Priestia megaterium TaxID=1404 RepID=UPI000BFE6AFA|nr:hypothetical protein [Priestia megaterium]PGO60612.1 hypothetical protein CN981_08670 [Priestia megaterium]
MNQDEQTNLAMLIALQTGAKDSYTKDELVRVCVDSYQLGKQTLASEISEGLAELRKLNKEASNF